jgi:hypothetical protein
MTHRLCDLKAVRIRQNIIRSTPAPQRAVTGAQFLAGLFMIEQKELPKLNPLQISRHVADLLLVSEGSSEAVRQPSVRLAWHLFFFSMIGFVFLQFLFMSISQDGASSTLTQIVRYSSSIGAFWLLISLAYLGCAHYRYLMLTGKDLRFTNVVFFFA